MPRRIVLSFAPSAAAVWQCHRWRIMCETNTVRRSVLQSVGQSSHFGTAVILHVFLCLVAFCQKHCSRNRLKLNLMRGCMKLSSRRMRLQLFCTLEAFCRSSGQYESKMKSHHFCYRFRPFGSHFMSFWKLLGVVFNLGTSDRFLNPSRSIFKRFWAPAWPQVGAKLAPS